MTKLTEQEELEKILARLEVFDPGVAILDPPIAGGRRDYPFGTRFEPDKHFMLNENGLLKMAAPWIVVWTFSEQHDLVI